MNYALVAVVKNIKSAVGNYFNIVKLITKISTPYFYQRFCCLFQVWFVIKSMVVCDGMVWHTPTVIR